MAFYPYSQLRAGIFDQDTVIVIFVDDLLHPSPERVQLYEPPFY